jgi:hypothetical protein
VGVAVAGAVGVAVAVAVVVGVAVGVGDPHGWSVAVNFWPVATGGAVPPVGSQPNSVKLVASCSTPTVRNLPVAENVVTSPYVKSKTGVPLSYRFTS